MQECTRVTLRKQRPGVITTGTVTWIFSLGNESNPAAGLHRSELFRNNGDGTFDEIAGAVSLDIIGYIKGVVWGDYNNDAWPDLFVSVYGGPNQLFRNEQGSRFVEVGAEAKVQEPLDSFPAWFWDYDQDGWLDIFVSGWRATAGDVAAEYLVWPGVMKSPGYTVTVRTAALRM